MQVNAKYCSIFSFNPSSSLPLGSFNQGWLFVILVMICFVFSNKNNERMDIETEMKVPAPQHFVTGS